LQNLQNQWAPTTYIVVWFGCSDTTIY